MKRVDIIPSIPQYAGNSNPYDTLWYLSFEIGRALLFDAKRIGSGVESCTPELLEKHARILNELGKLGVREREFLYNDSYFYKNNFQKNENVKMVTMGAESCSQMSFQSQLVSKEFLIATLGEDEGAGVYNKRYKLCQEAKGKNINFLYKCLDYLGGVPGLYTDGMKDFFENIFDDAFENVDNQDEDVIQSVMEDIQLMVDCINCDFKFYND